MGRHKSHRGRVTFRDILGASILSSISPKDIVCSYRALVTMCYIPAFSGRRILRVRIRPRSANCCIFCPSDCSCGTTRTKSERELYAAGDYFVTTGFLRDDGRKVRCNFFYLYHTNRQGPICIGPRNAVTSGLDYCLRAVHTAAHLTSEAVPAPQAGSIAIVQANTTHTIRSLCWHLELLAISPTISPLST